MKIVVKGYTKNEIGQYKYNIGKITIYVAQAVIKYAASYRLRYFTFFTPLSVKLYSTEAVSS